MIHRERAHFKPWMLGYQRQLRVRQNGTAALMDDRPQFTGKKPEWNTNKVILVAIGSIWTLAFLSALFTSAAGPSRTFMAFPLLGSFLIAGLVIFFAIFTGFHARRVKPMVEYDRTR